MAFQQDHIQRYMTPEGTFRILTADSTELIREAAKRSKVSTRVCESFGRLLTGAALMQLAQSPVDRVQCRVFHSGSAGLMLVDVWPGPKVRGRVAYPMASSEPIFGNEGTVGVSRQPLMRKAMPYESSVPLIDGDIGAALQRFVLESEQVLTMFSLVCVVSDDGGIERAGGLLVQALPGWEHEHLSAVTACLESRSFVDLVRAGDTPVKATEAIFSGLSLHHVGHDPLVYECRCSMDAAVRAVRLLDPVELAEIECGKSEKVDCDFCGLSYVVDAAVLRAYPVDP